MHKANSFSIYRVLILLLLIAVVAIAGIAFAVPQAQATQGFPMYSWGNNATGRLGRVVDVENPRYLPGRVLPANTGETSWAMSATAAGGSFAISSQGYLYAWGNDWDHPSMGQGDNLNPGSGSIEIPTRIDIANGWVHISARGTDASAAAINSQGHLYTWGSNASGRLGHGDIGAGTDRDIPTRVGDGDDWKKVVVGGGGTNVFMLGLTTSGYLYIWGDRTNVTPGLTLTPTRVGDDSNWQDITVGTVFAAAINTSGEMFTWGALAQLGRTPTATYPANLPGPIEVPTGTANNWSSAVGANNSIAAINDSGHIYTWGSTSSGQLGRLTDAANPANLPGRVGTADNWIVLAGAADHYLAFNGDAELWAWGNNGSGRLGIGSEGGSANTPQYVLTAERFSAASIGGGSHSIMLMNLDAEPVPLTKTLQLNEGTIIPDPAPSFTFNFERVRVALDEAVPPRMSNPLEGVGAVPSIPNQTITVDLATEATTGGITTVTGELNLWTLIQDILNDANVSGGVWVWEVTEVAGSSSLHSPPEVNMAYDNSRFQIRAHTNSLGHLVVLELFRMIEVENEWQIQLPKLEDGLEFINTYTRMVGDEYAALYISKTVVGEMANLQTPFSFTLTLTSPALTPPHIGSAPAGTVTAEIVNATTGASFVPVREVPITTGANNFTLLHNEKLRIPQLPAGTRFQVTEAAVLEFQPSATVTGIPVAPATGTYPQQEVNTALTTGTYIIHQENENRASFTNEHRWSEPMGLFITSTPWIAVLAATLLLALLAAKRNRKRIEAIPLVY